MGRSALRSLVSCVLIAILPASLIAADSGSAMLYTSGAAWVNGAHVPSPSSAIFSGDLLQTRADSVAKINQPGSTISIFSDSLVKFEGASVRIEHGGVAVSTAKQIATTAGDVRVTPVSNAWTEFNVSDVDGIVRIAALKGDLSITDGQNTVTLAQGQETTRDESSSPNKDAKKKKTASGGAIPAAGGGAMNSPLAVGAGAAAIGAVAIWVLVKNDEPASPSKP